MAGCMWQISHPHLTTSDTSIEGHSQVIKVLDSYHKIFYIEKCFKVSNISINVEFTHKQMHFLI